MRYFDPPWDEEGEVGDEELTYCCKCGRRTGNPIEPMAVYYAKSGEGPFCYYCRHIWDEKVQNG